MGRMVECLLSKLIDIHESLQSAFLSAATQMASEELSGLTRNSYNDTLEMAD